MNLQINSKNFTTEFINPILEMVVKGRTPIFTNDNGEIYTIANTETNTVYLLNSYKPIKIDEPIKRFNINLETVKKAIQCIKDEFITLNIDHESMRYSDQNVKLNIRLIDDSTISVAKFNIDVLKSLSIDFETVISAEIIKDIRKAMDFSSDTFKFYLQREDGKIYIYFGDKLKSHTSNIRILLTDTFNGSLNESLYDTAILQFALRTKSNIKLKCSNVGALIIEIQQENSSMKYITTQLKK